MEDFPPLQPTSSLPPRLSLPSTTTYHPPPPASPASLPGLGAVPAAGASALNLLLQPSSAPSPPRPSILPTCSAPASASPAKLGLELPARPAFLEQARPAFSEQARPSPSLLDQPSSSPPLSPPPSTTHHLLSPLGESKVDSFSAPLGALSVPNSTAVGLVGLDPEPLSRSSFLTMLLPRVLLCWLPIPWLLQTTILQGSLPKMGQQPLLLRLSIWPNF